ncbi:MAG: hypothetical protein AABY80_00380 [Candidatus Deferrimicrobiota bacterium]
MPSKRDWAQILAPLFRRTPVALLDQLCRALKTTSRTTVFRALTAIGYLTSYSHAGRYYTLKHLPQFDAHGLWFFRDVRFSVHRTLRATVEFMVRQAPAGYTHEELQAILGLRVHDPLRSLVNSGGLTRERVGPLYVYVDLVPQAAAAQLARRRACALAAPAKTPLDLPRVVDVLVAVIRDPRASASQIAAYCRARGLSLTDAQVEDVFARYDLGKKTAPSRSRHSGR